MSNVENARGIDDEDGDLPNGGRLRGSRFRSREDVDKSRKDLLMHILNRTDDFHTSEDEDKEGSRTINPYGMQKAYLAILTVVVASCTLSINMRNNTCIKFLVYLLCIMRCC